MVTALPGHRRVVLTHRSGTGPEKVSHKLVHHIDIRGATGSTDLDQVKRQVRRFMGCSATGGETSSSQF